MENQVLAVAYSKLKEDDKFSFYLPEEFAEIVTEIIISFDPSLHKTIKYPKSLAGLPTRIINKNNLKDESYTAFRKSKVIFISYYLDSCLADILKELPNVEGYYRSADNGHLTKIKNKMFFFDIVEKVPKEIIVGNFPSNSTVMIYPNEDEWIINDRVENLNKYFATANILAFHYPDDFIYYAILSQLKHKTKLIFENIYSDNFLAPGVTIEKIIRDKKKSKTVFVFYYFDFLPKILQSEIERSIKQGKKPRQKFVFSFQRVDHTFKYLNPVKIKFPKNSELISKYTPSEVFKLLILFLSRDVGKDIWLFEIPSSLTDNIIKKLNLFRYDLRDIYTILWNLFKEQDSISVNYSTIDFWYEIFSKLNERYPQLEEYKGDEDISVVSSRRISKTEYLSHLPNQLSFELIVLPKKGTDDVKKNWEIKQNGKLIKNYDYSTKFIHIIKELYDCYLEGRVIDGEELSREVDSKLGIVGKSEEQDKKIDRRRNEFNKLRGSKREFLKHCSLEDLRKHFVISEDVCSFDPKEELGITFLYPNKD